MSRSNVRVTALIVRNGKILIIKRFKNGENYWVLPGGGVEEGETLDQALKREVLEETGLAVLDHELLDDSDSKFPFFRVKLSAGDPHLGLGPESDANSKDNSYILTWVSLDELGTLHDVYPSTTNYVVQTHF